MLKSTPSLFYDGIVEEKELDMLDRYVNKGGKRLRYGYTTGSCGTAAVKAALTMLLEQHTVEEVTIDTPKGWTITIPVYGGKVTESEATCYVIKDAGDDPDVTDGLHIYARVRLTQQGITLHAGEGIGRVTKKGLSIPVGEAAINPVPRQMIYDAARELLGEDRGCEIELWIPKGAVIAKKTFNEKLGIVGGISIIGTTGIVEPMSEEAFMESVKLEMDIMRAEGKTVLIFVFGNYGEAFLREQMHLTESALTNVLKTSNFVAPLLAHAAAIGIETIHYVGHIGKMVKIAAGMPNTHSRYGDNRMETLVACGQHIGMDKELLATIGGCNTTAEVVDLIEGGDHEQELYDTIVKRAQGHCEAFANNQVTIDCSMFCDGRMLATTQGEKGGRIHD